MESRRARYGAVLLVLICALATASIECRNKMPHTSFDNEGGLESHQIDAEMAELIWNHCWKELMDEEDAFRVFRFYKQQEGTTDMKSKVLTNENIQKDISALPPQMEQALMHCSREKCFLFQVSGKQSSFRNWFTEDIELVLSLPSSPRRYLQVNEPPRQREPNPDQVLSLVPRRARQSPGAPPVSSPSPNSRSRPLAPHPAANKNSLPDPQPADTINSPSDSDNLTKQVEKKEDDRRKKEIIIACVATAVTTFALVALLFFCCLRNRSKRIRPGDGQKDDRPLLNLSLSAGSSQQSMSFGSSGNKQGTGNCGKDGSPGAMKGDNNSPQAPSGQDGAGTPLKPPPGRAVPPPPPPQLPPPPPPPKPRPPPPPKVPAPPKPLAAKKQPSPLGPNGQKKGTTSEGDELDGESGGAKTKLKPFFWDKVVAGPDQSMVWHEINAGSFQFNEEMIESLFGYTNAEKAKNERRKESKASENTIQYIQIIDTRKAQNLSIILRALNLTTEEVVDALQGGTELPAELLQTLLKMAPTADEELKLRLFAGDISQLGPAERFLKALVEIPFAFKRVEALLFMNSHQEEVTGLKESFKTLEVACDKLRSSRLFLKLLEAVLKTGNRMNDGTYRGGAQAFKLDTLLKLSDVKGTDGKTTLLHFVVQEIIRSEGIRAARAARESHSMSSMKSEEFGEDTSTPESAEKYCSLGLQVVSGLSNELEDVKKAAVVDGDSVTATVSKLSASLKKNREFLEGEMKSMDKEIEFRRALTSFVERVEGDIAWLLEEEKRIMSLVKSTADYFHGNSGRDEGLRLFVIVRDFLIMLDKACREVKATNNKPTRTSRKENLTPSNSTENRQPFSDVRQKLFPAIANRRMDFSSSDEES